ncbi:MAG: arsenate reductase [Gammaproteobacteria bacterium]|nr:arsenate reductase [Gammaproteobacteria bacterium]MYD81529.1 arsenate reductase [Gammaproteobacteria bacterium]
MSDFQIYFNPNCSKCRTALNAIQNKGLDPNVVRYLEDPLTEETLRGIITILSDPIDDLVRKDRNFEALGLNPDNYREEDSVVSLLLKHPELMQRPVVVQNGQARIVRSQERIDEVVSG